MNEQNLDLTFSRPAVYRIRVRESFPTSWADRGEGMAIAVCKSGDDPPVSTLLGKLADQASLAGVVNTLYELHLPILSLECLDAASS